jgi:hypothetical protein
VASCVHKADALKCHAKTNDLGEVHIDASPESSPDIECPRRSEVSTSTIEGFALHETEYIASADQSMCLAVCIWS